MLMMRDHTPMAKIEGIGVGAAEPESDVVVVE
jgi:hypothetical protein